MRAFDVYYSKRAEGGVAWPKRRYGAHRCWKVFMQVAKMCRDSKRDVEKFVDCVLSRLRKRREEVVPQDLLSKDAEAAWAEQCRLPARATAADRWAQAVRALLQLQRDVGHSDEEILASPFYMQFPAWFRLVYPEKVDAGILGSWGEAAVEELHGDRDMVRFLRAAMPEKLVEIEDRLGVVDGL